MRKCDWLVRAATTEEFKQYGENLGFSVRAWVLEMENKIIGIGGVVLKNGAWTTFLKVCDDSFKNKRVLYLAMKNGFDRILMMKLPVLYAIKDKELATAEGLLKKFNFRSVGINNDEEIYKWVN